MTLNISSGPQTLTAAGVVTGNLNTSALALPCTLFIEIQELTPANASVTVTIEDTAHATAGETVAFDDAATDWTLTLVGEVAEPAPVMQSARSVNLPAMRFGAANNQLRAHVTGLSAGATVTLAAWIAQ
jgi:hypothetical protein